MLFPFSHFWIVDSLNTLLLTLSQGNSLQSAQKSTLCSLVHSGIKQFFILQPFARPFLQPSHFGYAYFFNFSLNTLNSSNLWIYCFFKFFSKNSSCPYNSLNNSFEWLLITPYLQAVQVKQNIEHGATEFKILSVIFSSIIKYHLTSFINDNSDRYLIPTSIL